jgi:hypothetical protein
MRYELRQTENGKQTYIIDDQGRTVAICPDANQHNDDAKRIMRALAYDSQCHGDGDVSADLH